MTKLWTIPVVATVFWVLEITVAVDSDAVNVSSDGCDGTELSDVNCWILVVIIVDKSLDTILERELVRLTTDDEISVLWSDVGMMEDGVELISSVLIVIEDGSENIVSAVDGVVVSDKSEVVL